VELRAPVALGAPKYPAIPDGTDFTAIVRYVSRQAGVAKVEVSSARDSWTEIGHDWPQTDEPQWLQIWPVPLEHGTRSLRIRITAEGGTAPLQLDAAGFVPGRPWCLEQSTPPPFMGICTGTYVVRSVRH